MSKKKLFILPVIVLVIVSIMSISVMAASGSASNNKFEVYDSTGANITSKFACNDQKTTDGFKLSNISGLQDEISKIDKKLKVSDFSFKYGLDIYVNTPDGNSLKNKPWKVVLTGYKVPKGYAAIIVHVPDQGTPECKVFTGSNNYPTFTGVTSCSPFYVFTAKLNTSAQTGDYAPAYVAMISIGLLACGAFFALRAKKEAK